jgi:hypothetical protein
MKKFIAVIFAAIVIGGFVGAELMDNSFSITGAVVGGVGTAAFLLGLGAFFDAQDKKRKDKDLPPEIRAVFDRMYRNDTPRAESSPRQQMKHPITKNNSNLQEKYISTAYMLVFTQLMLTYPDPKKAFGAIMVNKQASGYLFGFHDSLLQRMGLYDPKNKGVSFGIIERSYKNIFGEQAGHALFDFSVTQQNNQEFIESRMNGGNEIVQYLENNVHPLGLGRILVLGMDS